MIIIIFFENVVIDAFLDHIFEKYYDDHKLSQIRRTVTYMVTDAFLFRLQNDLYCVGWCVKLYSLTHSPRLAR